jgi:hypothetical protein
MLLHSSRLELNQVQAPFRRAGAIAFQTNAANDERVPQKLELIVRGHLAKGSFDVRMLKLDHFTALLAHEMLVLRIPVIVFEKGACPKVEPAQQACVHEFGQGPVNCCAANIETGRLQVVDQLIGVEMMMSRKNVLDEFALLVGEPLSARPAGQILAELVFGRLGYVDGRKGQRTNSLEENGLLSFRTLYVLVVGSTEAKRAPLRLKIHCLHSAFRI